MLLLLATSRLNNRAAGVGSQLESGIATTWQKKSDPPTSAWLMPAKTGKMWLVLNQLIRLQALRSLAGNRWSLLKTCLKEGCYA